MHNPDMRYGMVSCLRLPLTWSDGENFGTFCVLDNKENAYSTSHEKLLAQLRDVIEMDLRMTLESAKDLARPEWLPEVTLESCLPP